MTDTKHTVLVVEDEAPLLEAIQEKLETKGFNVVVARTCDDAIVKIDEVGIDAVWLDHYLLGDKTGLDFIAHVKEHDARKDIPVFVVTNTGTHDKKETYMQLGAVNYYIKANHKLGDIITDITTHLAK